MSFFIIEKIKSLIFCGDVIEKKFDYSKAINSLKDGIVVAEIENGMYIVDDIFRKVYGHAAPIHGNHVVTLCKMQDGSYRFANYLNYWVKDKACYIGGALTDRELIKNKISAELRESIGEQGGLTKIAIMHVIDRSANNVSAIFGHTSVPRALEVILELGFVSTREEFLYVKWSPDVTKRSKKKLLSKAIKMGAF